LARALALTDQPIHDGRGSRKLRLRARTLGAQEVLEASLEMLEEAGVKPQKFMETISSPVNG